MIEELSDVDSTTAWAAVTVPESAPKSVTVVAKGTGGPAELHPILGDEDVTFGAIRVTAVDRKGTRVSLRARIVYFVWNGHAISHATRLRNSNAIKVMKEYFKVRKGGRGAGRQGGERARARARRHPHHSPPPATYSPDLPLSRSRPRSS